MKNLIKFTSALLLTSFLIVSCGNSITNDAKGIAELMCKAQKLQRKALTADREEQAELQEKLLQFTITSDSLKNAIADKYNSDEDKEELRIAVGKALASMDCK